MSEMPCDLYLLINDLLRMIYHTDLVIVNKITPAAASLLGPDIDPKSNMGFNVKLVFQLKCVVSLLFLCRPVVEVLIIAAVTAALVDVVIVVILLLLVGVV